MEKYQGKSPSNGLLGPGVPTSSLATNNDTRASTEAYNGTPTSLGPKRSMGNPWDLVKIGGLTPGKHTKNDGKSPCLMGFHGISW